MTCAVQEPELKYREQFVVIERKLDSLMQQVAMPSGEGRIACDALFAHIDALSMNIDKMYMEVCDPVGHVENRVDRLETLLVVGPVLQPSVDRILGKMLEEKNAATSIIDKNAIIEPSHGHGPSQLQLLRQDRSLNAAELSTPYSSWVVDGLIDMDGMKTSMSASEPEDHVFTQDVVGLSGVKSDIQQTNSGVSQCASIAIDSMQVGYDLNLLAQVTSQPADVLKSDKICNDISHSMFIEETAERANDCSYLIFERMRQTEVNSLMKPAGVPLSEDPPSLEEPDNYFFHQGTSVPRSVSQGLPTEEACSSSLSENTSACQLEIVRRTFAKLGFQQLGSRGDEAAISNFEAFMKSDMARAAMLQAPNWSPAGFDVILRAALREFRLLMVSAPVVEVQSSVRRRRRKN